MARVRPLGRRRRTSSAPASATAAAAVRPMPSASVNALPGGVGELAAGRAADLLGDRVGGADRLAGGVRGAGHVARVRGAR